MFLSCGDALFDLFAMPQNSSEVSPTAISLSGDVGGSPLNVAVGMSRLGHRSGYFTKLSTDVFGQRMRKFLEINDIDTGVSVDTSLNTTLAIVETQADGSASYVFYTDNTADVNLTLEDLPSTLGDTVTVLHFGSYSTVVEPTATTLRTLANRETESCFISYDPNLRPSVEPDLDKWRDAFDGFAATAKLIKASDEDIQTLFGSGKEDNFVADCFSRGAELVFITRGPDGSSGFARGGKQVVVPGVAVDVVDTVGAGDTFQAAMLHYLKTNNHIDRGQLVGVVDLERATRFAISAAAITCTRAGADLPSLSDVADL
ncbi:MAG: carbohydrate kinase [Gammaproteobacteria bacterium]|nr:carbohydrate kinase [Gammaproteobacteria bacterium]